MNAACELAARRLEIARAENMVGGDVGSVGVGNPNLHERIRHVGALGDSAAATTANIAALDASIRNLNADVNAQIQTPAGAQFLTSDWAPFFVNWQGWFSENGTVPLLTLPGVNFNTNKGPEFVEFIQAYNEHLRAFQALGFPTTAKRSSMADPPGWFSSLTGALGGVGTALVAAAVIYVGVEAYGVYKAAR